MDNTGKVLALITAVVGLLAAIITLFNGCGPTDTEPPPSTPTAVQSSPQSDSTQASAQPPPAATQERHGDVTLTGGDQVDLETGQVGKSVPNNDLSLSGDVPKKLIPSSGSFNRIWSDVTAENCRKEFEDGQSSSSEYIIDGQVFCLQTVEGHMATVAIVEGSDRVDLPLRLKYTVWL